jgi:excisionase family DNA binding protein
MDRLPNDLLSTNEVAAYFKITPNVVRAWIRQGKLPALRLGGTGSYRVKPEDLLAFLNRG